MSQVPPHSGFKRYQLDKLAFLQHPDPRVLTYAARREQGEVDELQAKKERLFGAHSEVPNDFATRDEHKG